MNTFKRGDRVAFRDYDGQTKIGWIATLPDHPLAFGQFHLSVAQYQGLISVRPENIRGLVTWLTCDIKP